MNFGVSSYRLCNRLGYRSGSGAREIGGEWIVGRPAAKRRHNRGYLKELDEPIIDAVENYVKKTVSLGKRVQ